MNDFITSLFDKLQAIFDPETIGAWLAEGIVNLLIAISVYAIFYLVWRIVQFASKSIFSRSKLDQTSSIFISSIIKYTILIFGAVTALDSVGIKTSAILTSLGIVGLTIGFAARDSLSNIISGIIIFLDRPFVIGDLVEVDGNYGKVDRITLRSTRIVTVDGKMLAVPNVDVINKTVSSYTNFPHLRLDVQVTVAVTEDIDKARSILLSLVQDESIYMTEPAPTVVVRALNDYNVLLEVRAWIHNERDHVALRFNLREKIFKAFNEHKVAMPFETFAIEPLKISMESAN
ncbi:MAG: mechanosensitive ion channel family protein [Balneolaceae bacterium]|nr:mechanosensitive ion channel family protein [Balneolaceae bacterium]